ncbi:sugar isomerase, partial [Candidatus Sumerlaeota bacterium]|nr:sugar isomerase [Candidatus Sumerlaeota bacterium]
ERVRGGEFDVLLIFGAGAGGDVLEALASPNRPTVIFVRHRTGPAYLWYEIVHPRFLRKTVDEFGQPGVDVHDVVVDNYGEVLWRLRALKGLRDSMGQKIIAIGNAGGWGAGGRKAADNARERFHMEIVPVSYEELDKRIKKARADSKRTAKAEADTKALLRQRGISLHCDRQFVVNALLLNDVFKDLMAENNTDAITVLSCMGTIMPVTETTACLPLMLLNDEGYMAFCESDFVVIPSGILLHHISELPVFLCNPTYPHEGVITVAHCTAPSKMDGRHSERTLIMTHYESDYGAAPKVEMRKGQTITLLDPDFGGKRWLGFRGKVVGSPYLDICRAQQDVAIEGDCTKLMEEMRGFHWMVCYGDYRKEVAYALKKAGIGWLDVTEG